MSSEIFRKKSIDRINSPEAMNDYMHVAGPGIWLILAAILLVLAGGIVWGIFGRIDTRIPAAVVVDNASAVCYFSEAEAGNVKDGMKVIINDREYVINSVASSPVKIDADNYYVADILDKEGASIVIPASLTTDLSDGIYRASIVIEEFAPVKFLTN